MQRVSIARALAGGQPLLLADEPTGNLSQKAGAEVMGLLRQCADEDRRAVLLVTHNPRDAAFADRVHFLVDGEIAKEPVLRGPKIPVEDVHSALATLRI
jgi:putative ABC transport system ATP-binding protein